MNTFLFLHAGFAVGVLFMIGLKAIQERAPRLIRSLLVVLLLIITLTILVGLSIWSLRVG